MSCLKLFSATCYFHCNGLLPSSKPSYRETDDNKADLTSTEPRWFQFKELSSSKAHPGHDSSSSLAMKHFSTIEFAALTARWHAWVIPSLMKSGVRQVLTWVYIYLVDWVGKSDHLPVNKGAANASGLEGATLSDDIWVLQTCLIRLLNC